MIDGLGSIDHRYLRNLDALDGGVVSTLCHPFDYLRWLLGEVESVLGMVDNLGDLGLEVEDTTEVVLKILVRCPRQRSSGLLPTTSDA
jgi:predicted dehydrogenase